MDAPHVSNRGAGRFNVFTKPGRLLRFLVINVDCEFVVGLIVV